MKKVKRPSSVSTSTAAAAAAAHAQKPRSAPLDFSSIPTRDSASLPQNDGTAKPLPDRMFNLPEAPTYYPTPEEFVDPLKYIAKIRSEVEKVGICKVVPPEGWKPGFSIDTETLRFETRLQKLNSMEGETRANLNYLEQLYKWHRQAGHPVTRVPMLDKKPVDLFRLKKEVAARGGMEKVTEGKKWAEIGRTLKLDRKTCTSMSNSLKQAYLRVCLPYEEFLAKTARAKGAIKDVKKGVSAEGADCETLKNGRDYVDSRTPCDMDIDDPPIAEHRDRPADLAGVAPHELASSSSPALASSLTDGVPSGEGSAAPTDVRLDNTEPVINGGQMPTEKGNSEATMGKPFGSPQQIKRPKSSTPTQGVDRPLRRSGRSRNSTQNGSNASLTGSPASTRPPSPAKDPATFSTGSSVSATMATSQQSPTRKKRNASTDPVGAEPKRAKSASCIASTKESIAMQDEYSSDSTLSDVILPDGCEICKLGTQPSEMLLCDGCDKGYHTFCLVPPLTTIPKSEWYCTRCLVQSGDDYGFEEGEEYSLHAFQKKADDFKRRWFGVYSEAVGVDQYGAAKGGVAFERIVEREFWRLVESPHDNCEVEYGADLHSTVHGSGFPTIEKFPLDPYSRHGWNLNVMPVLPSSLFSHIKSDISGMMVPWLYVGMCFSTFCWHNEDHYTYSINYMHWGDTKTWYGVPAADAEKFENVMREAVPELFENNPDLLFQLVTMLSPGRLVKSGVKVVAVDQRPGQFVITFPQSYHAGFNHGFNFAEAVNFAPHDWEPYGLACAQRYAQYHKMPVFSHDELLVNILQNDSSIRTALWLGGALILRRDQEVELRNKVRGARKAGKMLEVKDSQQREGELARCAYCNAYCYFSAIACECTETRVVCLEHERELCKCDQARHYFRLMYTDKELDQLANKARKQAAMPEELAQRVQAALAPPPSTRRPLLKEVMALISEIAELDLPYPLDGLEELKALADRSAKWIGKANALLLRKTSRRERKLPSGVSLGLLSGKKGTILCKSNESNKTRRLVKVGDLSALLEEAETLRFDSPEMRLLAEMGTAVASFKLETRRVLKQAARARAALAVSPASTLLDRATADVSEHKPQPRPSFPRAADVQNIQEVGAGLDVDVHDDISALDNLLLELEWRTRVKRKLKIASRGGGFGSTTQHHQQASPGRKRSEHFMAISGGVEKESRGKDAAVRSIPVDDLIAEGRKLGVSEEDDMLSRLVAAKRKGCEVEKQLRWILDGDLPISAEDTANPAAVPRKYTLTVENFKAVVDQAWRTVVPNDILERAQSLLTKIIPLSKHCRVLQARADAVMEAEKASIAAPASDKPAKPAPAKPAFVDLEVLLKCFCPTIISSGSAAAGDGSLASGESEFVSPRIHDNPLLKIHFPELQGLREDAASVDKWSGRGNLLFRCSDGVSKPLHELLEETEANVKNCSAKEAVRELPQKVSENGAANSEEDGSETYPENAKYCLCRSEEEGFMLQCSNPRCGEWYHGSCLRMNRKEAMTMQRYMCPICDVTQPIPRSRARPTLQDLRKLRDDGRALRFAPSELPILDRVVDMCDRFQREVDEFLATGAEFTTDEEANIKHYLRKVEGMEVRLPYQTECLRALVRRLCPVPDDPSKVKERQMRVVAERHRVIEAEYAALLEERVRDFNEAEMREDERDGVSETRQAEIVRCICDQPNDDSEDRFFVACDRCSAWFHGECVQVTDDRAQEEWFCARCADKRRRRQEMLNKHRVELERAKKNAAEEIKCSMSASISRS